MKRQITFPALCVLLFALCSPAEAQQSTKIPRIGYLVGNSLSSQAARIEAFRQGLRDLGYIEGKNIAIEWQSADGQFDGLPRLAAELVRLKVAVIVTGVHKQPEPPRKQLLRFRLSWPTSVILLATV
jgi:ABC-type uncharacterized transport system substrate-binding protein